MTYLLLARHGNTFATGDKVTWVGASNDLPLVESGLAQAKSLAQVLLENEIKPAALYSGPLKRTKEYATIIRDALQLSPDIQIDSRLNEIDYGAWSGLTSEEIKEKFGQDELDAWNLQGKWPVTFVGNEAEVEAEVNSFVQDIMSSYLENQLALAVTSNGRLKYFLKLLPDIYAEYIKVSKWKVSTGNICLLKCDKRSNHLVCWNEAPLELGRFCFNS